MAQKVWIIRDYEYSDGRILADYYSWLRWDTRSNAIERARGLGCRNCSIVDAHGNIEVIKYNGEVIAHV